MKSRKVLALSFFAIAIASIVFAICCFNFYVGNYEPNLKYGGDAYTGMQNASAQAANNVLRISENLCSVCGFIFIIIGATFASLGVYNLIKAKEEKIVSDKLFEIERNTKFTYNDEARQEYETNQITIQEALEKAKEEAEKKKAEAEEQREEAAKARQEKVEQIKNNINQIKDKIDMRTEAEKQRDLANEARKRGETLVVKANKFGDVTCPCCNTSLYFEGNAVGVVKCSKCKCSLKIEK